MDRRVSNRGALVGLAALCALALAGCDDPDALANEAKEKADAACACENFECTRNYIKWFNKVSITQEDDLAAMSEEARASYKGHSLRAGDCQTKLRQQ